MQLAIKKRLPLLLSEELKALKTYTGYENVFKRASAGIRLPCSELEENKGY